MVPVLLPLLLSSWGCTPQTDPAADPGPDSDPPDTLEPLDDTAPPDDTDADDTGDTPGVYGVELLSNGGFEEGAFGAWLPQGCQVVASASGGLVPAEGGWMLFGGPGDCTARQTVDLLAAGASASDLDAGAVAVVASGWVANLYDAEAFDDQVLLRLTAADAQGEALAVLESLLGADGTWTLRELTAALPPGTRHLSVAVVGRFRQGGTNESRADAISVMLAPLAPRAARITLPPMLQDYRQDAMRIVWETDLAEAPARVEWGPAGGALSQVAAGATTTQIDAEKYLHAVTIEGLEAAERADYRVCVGDTCSAVYTLQTAPPAGAPLRVAWAADNQDNLSGYFEIHAAHMQPRDPDLLIMAGDVVQDGYDLAQWTRLWWGPLADAGVGQETPVLVALGNHEKEHPYTYAYASSPAQSAWFSFRYGDVFFVVLDTNAPSSSPDGRLSQARFLQDALTTEEARTATFRIVTFHEAPFNSVTTSTSASSLSWGDAEVQADWVPLLAAGGVDLVVSGHYHSYQRGTHDGVTYVVIGGGGGSLLVGPAESGPYADLFDVSTLAWHYAVMDVEDDTLVWRTYDLDDALLDTFTLAARPQR